jgi:hypothetical protein
LSAPGYLQNGFAALAELKSRAISQTQQERSKGWECIIVDAEDDPSPPFVTAFPGAAPSGGVTRQNPIVLPSVIVDHFATG